MACAGLPLQGDNLPGPVRIILLHADFTARDAHVDEIAQGGQFAASIALCRIQFPKAGLTRLRILLVHQELMQRVGGGTGKDGPAQTEQQPSAHAFILPLARRPRLSHLFCGGPPQRVREGSCQCHTRTSASDWTASMAARSALLRNSPVW